MRAYRVGMLIGKIRSLPCALDEETNQLVKELEKEAAVRSDANVKRAEKAKQKRKNERF